MLCDLAAGRLDVLSDQHLKPWDTIAGLLIAHEAGAIVSDYLAPQTGEQFHNHVCFRPGNLC